MHKIRIDRPILRMRTATEEKEEDEDKKKRICETVKNAKNYL